MKTNYRKPVVETLIMSANASLMQAVSSGVPSFNGTTIEDNGIQGDAR
jgi:hypothetical protein